MYINSVSFKDFRCIRESRIELCRSVNLISGGNAQGKTSALEAVYMFACGRSFRSARDREVIRFDSDLTSLRLEFCDRRRENVMEIRLTRDGKRAFVRNGVTVRRLSEFVGGFRAVLFCPAHLSIVRDGPAVRRSFIDMAMTQLSPSYVSALQRYNGLLVQRNRLIKGKNDDPRAYNETIDIWSEELAASAAEVSRMRADYCERLERTVSAVMIDMTGGAESVTLSYTEPKSAEEYSRLLKVNRERELAAGMTLYGAHRDDLTIKMNGIEARLYCSQGQQRSIALAMKLAEGEISKAVTGEYPVFLFDDILSELDANRRAFVLAGLEGRQVIITSCDSSYKAQRVITASEGSFTCPADI